MTDPTLYYRYIGLGLNCSVRDGKLCNVNDIAEDGAM